MSYIDGCQNRSNDSRHGYNNQQRDPNKRPTFRAKGVVKNVGSVDEQHPNFLYAELDIGGIIYEVPVCRNTEVGDVLAIRIDVLKVGQNRRNGEED